MYKYTVEFVQKPYVKRPIADSLLEELLVILNERSKTFALHKDVFGSQNGGYVRFVHFFSDLNFGYVHEIVKKYAEEKRFDFVIRQLAKPQDKKMYKKGGIMDWLNKTI